MWRFIKHIFLLIGTSLVLIAPVYSTNVDSLALVEEATDLNKKKKIDAATLIRLKELMAIGRDKDYPKVTSIAALKFGKYYKEREQWDSCLIYYKISLATRKSLQNPIESAWGHYLLGKRFNHLSHLNNQYLDSAQIELTSSWDSFLTLTTLDDKALRLKSKIWVLEGDLYNKSKDYKKALPFFRKALAIQKGEASKMAWRYNAISICLYQLGEYDSTLMYIDSIYNLQKIEPLSKEILLNADDLKGIVFTEQAKYDSALFYKKRELAIRKKDTESQSEIAEIANTYIDIGYIFEKQKEWKAAEIHYLKALDYAKSIQNQDLLLLCHNNLRDVYSAMEKHKDALFHANEKLKIRDIIIRESRTLALDGNTHKVIIKKLEREQDEDKKIIDTLTSVTAQQRNLFGSVVTGLTLVLALLFWSARTRKKLLIVERSEKQTLKALRNQEEKTHQQTLKTLSGQYNQRVAQTLIQSQNKAHLEVKNQMKTIGHDLHDLAQSNIAISRTLLSKLINDLDETLTPKQKKEYEFVDEAIESARQGIRRITEELKKGMGIVLKMDLADFLDDIRTSFASYRETGVLNTRLTTKNLEGITIPQDMLADMAMLIQEALNNVLVHANANTLRLHIEYQRNEFLILVEDDGIGFKVDANDPNQLSSMKARVKKLNGKLTANSNNSKEKRRTSLSILIPFSS